MLNTKSPNYVVRIFGKTHIGEQFNGTGIIVSQDIHVITCLHVVSKASEIKVELPYPYDGPGKYQVYDKQESEDLALLASCVPLDAPTNYAQFHSNWREDTKPGQDVSIWGFSTEQYYAAPQHIPCTIREFDYQHGRIGLSATINPGDSGGPVVDTSGKVIGIVNAKDSKRAGHGQAIPIPLAAELLEKHGIASSYNQAKSIQLSTRRRVPKCEIPPILPYLPNRDDQEYELSEQLQYLQKNKPRRPFICIIHCDEEECSDAYLERLEASSIIEHLGLDYHKNLIERKHFCWPTKICKIDQRCNILLSNLAESLIGRRSLENFIENLFQRISQYKASVFIIATHLNTKNCYSDERELIAHFINFWNDYPDLPLGQFLFICLCIEYKEDKDGFWQSHFGQGRGLGKLNNSIECFITNLDFSTHDKLHGVTLSKLPPIQEEQAQDWVRGKVHDFFVQKMQKDESLELERKLRDRIHLIYENSSGLIPMEKLAEKLKTLLEEAWA